MKTCEHSGAQLEPSNKREISYEELEKAWLDNEGMLPMPKDCPGFQMLAKALGLCPRKPMTVEFETNIAGFAHPGDKGWLVYDEKLLACMLGKRVHVTVRELP